MAEKKPRDLEPHECPYCRRVIRGNGFYRHKAACQYKSGETVIDLMAVLQKSLAKSKRRTAFAMRADGSV